MPRVIFKIRDQDKDTQQFSFPANVSNAGTFTAQAGQFAAFEAALGNIILGVIAQSDYAMLGNTGNGVPTNPFAQTNIQWIAVWTDTLTADLRRTRIGTANLDLLALGSTELNAGTEFVAFKAAFEALVRSELGNPVILNKLEYVE